MEREKEDNHFSSDQSMEVSLTEEGKRARVGAVWHAGDWIGPRILQPEKRLSGDSSTSLTHDIVAMSAEGVKVRFVEFRFFLGIMFLYHP